MEPPLVLASASPRRRELLAGLGVVFEVVPSSVPETPQPGEDPEAFARRAAREKALDVARRRPGKRVLGADTVVVLGRTIFGKPVDRDDARRMLQALSATEHRVLTAVVLVDPDGRTDEVVTESRVEFRRLAPNEIETYLDSGEPFDKAGAYGIQGGAARFVARVDGSYANVVGLPLEAVAGLLGCRDAPRSTRRA